MFPGVPIGQVTVTESPGPLIVPMSVAPHPAALLTTQGLPSEPHGALPEPVQASEARPPVRYTLTGKQTEPLSQLALPLPDDPDDWLPDTELVDEPEALLVLLNGPLADDGFDDDWLADDEYDGESLLLVDADSLTDEYDLLEP